MARPQRAKRQEGAVGRARGKGKGKPKNRGLGKGAKEKVGLSSDSRPKFKRNPRKFKSKVRGRAAAQEKSVVAAVEKGGEGESETVSVGSKRRRATGGEREGDKKTKVLVKKVKEKQPLSRKERRNLKKKKRKNFDLISEALKLWETLRRHDLKEGERSDLLEKMMSHITGHIHEFALKHDTARIVQCCLKYGTPQHHTTVFTELKDHVVELSKSKYAKFAVKAMMRLCTPDQRHQLIAGLYGNVHRLARHKEAAEIVETAYNDFANAGERASLVQEFYGRKFALFKSREGEERSLGDILGGEETERESVLTNMKEALTKLLDKSVVRHSIVHRALLDYLTHCDHTSRSEMIDQLKELLVEILHTRDGSRVTLHCLWHGSTKVRKVIVKSFKPYVKKICLEENGHVVMMGVFDTVDDTVLVKKAILTEMVGCLGDICESVFGRRVILYLLSPRNRQHFSSQFLKNVLEPGDGNEHTKKPREVRDKELLEAVSESLVQLARERAVLWAQSKPHSPLLLQIASSVPGSVCQISGPLVDLLAEEFNPDGHLVVHPSGHWVVKRLLNHEAKEKEKKERESFAEMILERVSEDNLRAWTTTNRGAFVICSLLCSGVEGVRERVASALEPVMQTVRTGTLEGQKALWKEINTNTHN